MGCPRTTKLSSCPKKNHNLQKSAEGHNDIKYKLSLLISYKQKEENITVKLL